MMLGVERFQIRSRCREDGLTVDYVKVSPGLIRTA
jgi:hypothetical protein